MKALVCEAYGPVENLVYRDMPDPVPGAGEIRVVIEAIGVNFPDGLLVEGKYQAKPQVPFMPGGEFAGQVAALGPGASGFAVGDRVLGWNVGRGAYAEQIAVPAGELFPLPASMSMDQGAALLCATATAHHALRQRGRLQAGETLVVLGAAGGTGIAAVQIGKAIGARVIAVCSSDEKIAFAKAQGADEGINYSREDLNQAIKRLTDGRGADVVYDAVGGDAFDACSRAMAWDGRLLIIGFASGRIPTLPVNLTLVKGYSVIGVFWGAFTQREPAAYAANMRELFAWFEQGKVVPVIDRVFALADGVKAIQYVTGRGARGKVVIRP
ncbi:MAG: NADPH:quinone oxidoreductase family protein [Gammaproteobacteria bacterium]|nr:NADPH:quinone oxidoreductase family protein [Gammaproteobacteria bacterium]MBK9426092.1 NADPH:quinone oxidoreductase family protein [Gammaproteobacteria bacterium]